MEQNEKTQKGKRIITEMVKQENKPRKSRKLKTYSITRNDTK